MGNETKWADVAHYYAKSPISVSYKHELMSSGSIWSYSIQQLIESMLRIENGVVINPEGAETWAYTPVLRHLDDMTEAEAREIYRLVWGFDIDISVSMWDSGIDYFESLYGRYPSVVFLWLISRSFDLFGLIESGQAIRKEAGNG